LLQEELETHDGVSKGKYTIGLGQESMAFCTEVEDVISMRYIIFSEYLLVNAPIFFVFSFLYIFLFYYLDRSFVSELYAWSSCTKLSKGEPLLNQNIALCHA